MESAGENTGDFSREGGDYWMVAWNRRLLRYASRLRLLRVVVEAEVVTLRLSVVVFFG